ncbi:hypothetical protein DRW41_17175 [Neobacillus piezotolerans]|uniref:Replication protein n=1 Tax=Neobacillus piezotolerans TaxID=2259171 RepID=A0A3D8GMA8_9BACI|nr:hypothetical protein [Neobacillus piezotolerans]RDU35472.1 hypothetical protein DRW41_17175 [Neobacillus piezotolerans]
MSNPKIPGGYIIVSRKIVESEIWGKPPLYLKVWIYLLTLAQHANYKNLKRGQLITSVPDIVEACKWKVGYRTERPTEKEVRGVINWLRKLGEGEHEGPTKGTMISTTKVTHGFLINIDNYSFYQDPKNYEGHSEGNSEGFTKDERKEEQGHNINKNVKNEKNEKKKDYSLQIANLRQRYSSEQLKAIDDYFEMLRHTRTSGKVSETIILKAYQDWDKFPTVCVEYGVRTHTINPAYHSRKENYTLGIIRNTSADEAAARLSQGNKNSSAPMVKKDSRDWEIAFNQWVNEGHDPSTEEFPWDWYKGRLDN